jgi:hypothetical protein
MRATLAGFVRNLRGSVSESGGAGKRRLCASGVMCRRRRTHRCYRSAVAALIEPSIPRRALRLTGSILVASVLAVIALVPIGIALSFHLQNAFEARWVCPRMGGEAGRPNIGGWGDGTTCDYPGGGSFYNGRPGNFDFFQPTGSFLAFLIPTIIVLVVWWLSVRWIHRTFMNPPRYVWRPYG